MSDQPESIIGLDLVHPLVKGQTDDLSEDMTNMVDEEDPERAWSLVRVFSSLMNRETVLLAAGGKKNWCYMIVTPPPDKRVSGVRSMEVDSRGKPVYQWLVKFGDGDPGVDTTKRYGTHNPCYRVEVNMTGREGKLFETKVFQDRGFKRAGQSKEWYIVWDRWERRWSMQADLNKLLKNWSKLDVNQKDKVDNFIRRAKNVIPSKSNSAV